MKVSCNGAQRIEFGEDKNYGVTKLNTSLYPNLTFENIEFSTYDKFIYNEDLIGIKNGVNNIFLISSSLIPNSEQILSNGSIINKPEDYNISGNIVILNFSPSFDEQLTTNYIKQ